MSYLERHVAKIRVVSNVPYRPPFSLPWSLNNAGVHAVRTPIAKASMNETPYGNVIAPCPPSYSSSPEAVAETSPPSAEFLTSSETAVSKQLFQPSENEFSDEALMLTPIVTFQTSFESNMDAKTSLQPASNNKLKSTLKSSENTDLSNTSKPNSPIARSQSGSNMISSMSPLSSWNADNEVCSRNESTFPKNTQQIKIDIIRTSQRAKSTSLATGSKIASTCGSLPSLESCYTPKAMKSRKADPIESSFISLSSALQAHLENLTQVETADVEKKGAPTSDEIFANLIIAELSTLDECNKAVKKKRLLQILYDQE